jgi:hypothetical protein
MLPVGRPRPSFSWFIVCNYFASWRSKVSFVVVHEAEVRKKFNVISIWGKSLSHKCNGKVGSTEENPATKCSLKVRMALKRHCLGGHTRSPLRDLQQHHFEHMRQAWDPQQPI